MWTRGRAGITGQRCGGGLRDRVGGGCEGGTLRIGGEAGVGETQWRAGE